MKLPEGKAIIGWKETYRAAKNGEVDVVIIAKHCPDKIINKFKELKNLKIEMPDITQEQLGTMLGKPFYVAVVGFKIKSDVQ